MWYFSWILGVLLAVSFGIINVMWYEMEQLVDNVSKDQVSKDQEPKDQKYIDQAVNHPVDDAQSFNNKGQ
ncbi:MAG: cytochrome bd-I oxidase subunit CydX [Psychrobium sp.]|nr:cytochrome bd-I oxidase subunit CydX [Psychrobium sp.]